MAKRIVTTDHSDPAGRPKFSPGKAEVSSLDVEEFQRKIKQAYRLALVLSCSGDALGMDEEDAAVLGILSDLLEEIEAMSGPVVEGVLQLFKRQLAEREAVHG
jgi:hypothetical protein